MKNVERNIERALELQDQAWSLQADGKVDEALIACRDALQLFEESEGPHSPEVANLLNDLAEVEHDRQNFQIALSLLERARNIEDILGSRFCGPDAVRVRGRTLELIGLIRCKLGDYECAETALKSALEMAATEFGVNSEEAADAKNNLAVVYKHWGRFEDGLELYRQALHTLSDLHGEESLACGVVYHNIGGILHARGDFAAAEPPGRKAWEISQRVLGEEDPRTMIEAVAYAAILDGLDRYDECAAIYRQALAIFEKAFGPEHYEVASTLHSLAAVLAVRSNFELAEAYYRRALAIKEKLLGPESPDAALTTNNLGKLLISVARSKEAVPLLEKAVAILSNKLTPGHPHLALARMNLRQALDSSGCGP